MDLRTDQFRVHGHPEPAFLQRLDETLGQMQAVLMDEGCSVRSALLICREAREIAREEWRRVSCRWNPIRKPSSI